MEAPDNPALSLRFADLTTVSTLQHMNRVLDADLHRLGVPTLDIHAVTSPTRALTQICARYIYEQTSDQGIPVFAGIRYISHFDANWECWAIFADRLTHTGEHVEKTIYPDDEDLMTIGRTFRLTFEVFPGHHIRPY